MPELKAWVTSILATIFSNLDSLTSEDGDAMARIAISDTSGSLLRDRYVFRVIPCAVTNDDVPVSYPISNGRCRVRIQRRQPS